jgi:hypothetical protein
MNAHRHGLSAMIEPLDDCHSSDIGIWGSGSVLSQLSKPVAEGVEAEEGHNTDFALETL